MPDSSVQVENQLPTEEILEMQENIDLLLEQQELQLEQQQLQLEQQSQVTGIDQFIMDNSETVLTTMNLLSWWGVVGVPLLIIVTLFWVVYKQFLYTRI